MPGRAAESLHFPPGLAGCHELSAIPCTWLPQGLSGIRELQGQSSAQLPSRSAMGHPMYVSKSLPRRFCASMTQDGHSSVLKMRASSMPLAALWMHKASNSLP